MSLISFRKSECNNRGNLFILIYINFSFISQKVMIGETYSWNIQSFYKLLTKEEL